MITKQLNLKILAMCEKILPDTRMANNKELKNLLSEIRTALEETK
jgi:hypothetical protein